MESTAGHVNSWLDQVCTSQTISPSKKQPRADPKLNFKVVKKTRATQKKTSRILGMGAAQSILDTLSHVSTTTHSNFESDSVSRPRREPRSTPLSDTSSVPAFSYRGIMYDFAQWPDKILRAKGPQPGFENFENFLAQRNDEKCQPGCECREADACPCVRNKTVCDLACGCAQNCARQFVGCGCRDGCSSSCWCHSKHRQCGPRCKCTECGNDLDPKAIPRMRVQPSTIPSAGEGLFCLSKIKYKQFLGSYDGVKILQRGDTDGVVMDFRISKTQCIRPDRQGTLLFKINYAAPTEANVQFLTFETTSGRKVLAFAVNDILPGTELLAWYGPECSDSALKHGPSMRSSHKFTKRELSVTVKPNGTGYEIHPLAIWQNFAAVTCWREFRVGQDVFVNHNSSSRQGNIRRHLTETEFITLQLTRCWVARIAEIRVSENNKARVVVVWYDRLQPLLKTSPDHSLEAALQPFELFGTHLVDIIDGDTISSPADVTYVKIGKAIPTEKLYYQYIQAEDRLNPGRRAEIFLPPPGT